MRTCRKGFAVLLLLMVAGTCFAYDNVLIFTIDTLRADYLGCNGSKKVKTPNIDALAAQGVVFRNTITPAPFTLPAHISILTGLIPPAHGVHDNGGFYLEKKVTTLAEKFKAEGMSTGAFVGAFPLDSRFGLNQGFDVYDDSYPTFSNASDVKMPERKADEVTDLALKWLPKQKGRWFAWIHYYDPHFPYIPPEPYKTTYANDLYAGEVAFADSQVGRVLKYLHDNGLDKKTLVVLTADHGESLGEHKETTHGIFAYESTLRVPLVIAPAKTAVINNRVRSIDIAPTILDLMKLSFTSKIQGRSLARMMDSTDKNARPEDSYFESLSMTLNCGWAPIRGFYSEAFKFIDLPIPELFNIDQDPHETNNLCSDKQLCDRWKAKFESFYSPYSSALVAAQPVDPETAEQLRALGYVSGAASRPPEKQTFGPKDDPKNMIVYHNRTDTALNWYNKGYELKALEILEGIIDEKPDYQVAYMRASYIYSAAGSPDKAVALLRKAIENKVDGAEVRGKLGAYLFESEKYDEAAKELLQALHDDPRDVDNWNYLGISQTRAGKFAEAEAAFQKAISIDPTDGTTLANMGTLYLTQKNYDRAIEKFQAAVAANPHIGGAYNGLGVVYATRKNWDEAIRFWTLAAQEDGKNYDAMLNLAYAYLEKNDQPKALDMFKKFQSNAPAARYANDLAKVRSLIEKLQ